jgi:hypothetical protein
MNIKSARKIAKHVAKIAEVSAAFQAKYGCDYKMTENSPAEAWELYNAFVALQDKIAILLDAEAVNKAHVRWEAWWERRDVINVALVNHLSGETWREAAPTSLLGIQETIAGLLHPATRHKAVGQSGGGMLGAAS